jgi:hypothetical protein
MVFLWCKANIDSKIGAIGFVPILFPNALPLRIIKIDEDTGNLIRNPKTGYVIQCGVNEPGELIGRIVKKDPVADFEGFVYFAQVFFILMFNLDKISDMLTKVQLKERF